MFHPHDDARAVAAAVHPSDSAVPVHYRATSTTEQQPVDTVSALDLYWLASGAACNRSLWGLVGLVFTHLPACACTWRHVTSRFTRCHRVQCDAFTAGLTYR